MRTKKAVMMPHIRKKNTIGGSTCGLSNNCSGWASRIIFVSISPLAACSYSLGSLSHCTFNQAAKLWIGLRLITMVLSLRGHWAQTQTRTTTFHIIDYFYFHCNWKVNINLPIKFKLSFLELKSVTMWIILKVSK